jgi:hypothetical protein
VEGILLTGTLVFVVLIPFFAFREFSRILGEEELKALLFRRRAKVETIQPKVQQTRTG